MLLHGFLVEMKLLFKKGLAEVPDKRLAEMQLRAALTRLLEHDGTVEVTKMEVTALNGTDDPSEDILT